MNCVCDLFGKIWWLIRVIFWCYRFKTNVFLITGTPPAPRYHHSAIVHNDSMFVFGGYTGDIYSNSNLRNKNDLFEYKFTTSQWINWEDRITGDLPPARSAHGAVVYDNRLWIFAGYDGHARLNDMWCIDLTSPHPQWEQVEQNGDNPPTCCNFPVAVVDDSMYVFSGQSGAKITNNLYQFRFKEKRWVRIRTEHLVQTSAPPQRRYGHTMVAYRRSLYVYGGAADGILDNEIHCFDVDTRTWSVIHPAEGSETPCRRVFHSAAVWNNSLYIFGGTIDSMANRSGDLFRFGFSTSPKCSLIGDITRLLKSETFCDIRFVLEENATVMAHVVMVAARSPFLRRKILQIYHASGDNLEQSDPSSSEMPPFLIKEPISITLEDVSKEVFKLALHSLYTDQIHPDLENHSREGATVSQMLLMVDIYKLSLLLETKRLEFLSIKYIEASINEENVLLVLKNATELGLSSLKEYCMRFIVQDSNYRKVVMSSSFDTLDRTLMVQIIRRQLFRSRPTSPDPLAAPDQADIPSSLQDDLKEFLDSDLGRPFTDISLRVGDQTVFAHKAILAARCAYFEALFRSFMPENHEVEITFGEVVPTLSAFLALLKYTYHGAIQASPEDFLYIFSAPNFFGFTNSRLHSYCKSSLEKDVNQSNVLKMLETADTINLQVMKKHCLDMIAARFPDIVRQRDFRSLRREMLLDILDILASKMASEH